MPSAASWPLLAVLALALPLLLAACGGDDEDNDETGAGGQGGADAQTRVTISADDQAFDKDRLVVAANTRVTVVFENEEAVIHNFAVYRTEQAGDAIYKGDLFSGPAKREETFRSPAPGTYFFRCDAHPDTMKGELVTR